MKRLYITLALVAGCGIPLETEETGPSLRLHISDVNSGRYVDDYGPGAGIRIDPDTNRYDLEVGAVVMEGDKSSETSYDRIAVSRIDVALAVDGETIPPAAMELAPDDSFKISWTAKSTFTLPAGAMGKSMTVRAAAIDDGGLRSNQIDGALRLE